MRKNQIFRNANGKDYLIIKQYLNVVLLAEIEGYDFVVSSGFDPTKDYWNNGAYHFNIDAALTDYNERIGVK